MKIIIEYDPNEGIVIPDNKISDWVKSIIDKVKFLTGEEVVFAVVGSLIIIDEFRALVSEGKLSDKDIIFKFEDKEIVVNKYGALLDWPKGFCDIYDIILERILFNRFERKIK